MPTLPIPFTPLNRSVDKSSQPTWNQGQYDGYWMPYQGPDGMQFIWHKRPGLVLFSDLAQPSKIDGGHYWVRQEKLMASCNAGMYMLDSAGSSSAVTGTGSMTIGVRPTFTDVQGSSLYAAANGQIAAYPSSGTGAYLTDGDAPTDVRFLGCINQSLVALRDADTRFDWADALAPTTWAGEYSNVEYKPDLAKAMVVANNYLHIFCQKSTELWYDDSTTFVRQDIGGLDVGISAPYSAQLIRGAVYFLDDSREFSRLNGVSVETISNPALSTYLRSFSTVSDCTGDKLFINGKQFYVASFPVEGKTLVYDILLNQWYEWSYWEPNTAERKAWRGSCIMDASSTWNKVLVGDRQNSKIYYVGGTTDNGETIRTVLRTDKIDRGSPEVRKFSSRLSLIFRRADTNTTAEKISVRWRDDGNMQWSDERWVSVEKQGRTHLRARLKKLGSYRNRIWEFTLSDPTVASLESAVETFTYGG